MFPYPSGAGLHVGHPEGYTATAILCRFKRAKGFNVLHPMGWDAFGHQRNNMHFRRAHTLLYHKRMRGNWQIRVYYDWSREVNTTDPDYYRWTQWISLSYLRRAGVFG